MTVAVGLYTLVKEQPTDSMEMRIGTKTNASARFQADGKKLLNIPMILRHLPNALTILRLILIGPFLLFLYHQEYGHAFYVFLLAGLTDGLDGWLARHFHWQSVFGSFIDPLADKLLISFSFISLALTGQLPWWLVILVFLRDLTISLGVLAWYGLIRQNLDFKPTRLSKINTVLQLMLVTVCLFDLAFLKLIPYSIDFLINLTAITTTASFIDYGYTWGKKAYTNAQRPQ